MDKIIEAKKIEVKERRKAVLVQKSEGKTKDFCLPHKFVSHEFLSMN